MIRLNMQQVLLLHEELIQETGGIHGFRDENLLETAPYSSLPDLQRSAAVSVAPTESSTALLWHCDESSLPRR